MTSDMSFRRVQASDGTKSRGAELIYPTYYSSQSWPIWTCCGFVIRISSHYTSSPYKRFFRHFYVMTSRVISGLSGTSDNQSSMSSEVVSAAPAGSLYSEAPATPNSVDGGTSAWGTSSRGSHTPQYSAGSEYAETEWFPDGWNHLNPFRDARLPLVRINKMYNYGNIHDHWVKGFPNQLRDTE